MTPAIYPPALHYISQAKLARILELVQRAHEMRNAIIDSGQVPTQYDYEDLVDVIDRISVIITED